MFAEANKWSIYSSDGKCLHFSKLEMFAMFALFANLKCKHGKLLLVCRVCWVCLCLRFSIAVNNIPTWFILNQLNPGLDFYNAWNLRASQCSRENLYFWSFWFKICASSVYVVLEHFHLGKFGHRGHNWMQWHCEYFSYVLSIQISHAKHSHIVHICIVFQKK